jgi:hypothetical protein
VGVYLVADEQIGFLGRWARRKSDVIKGKAVQEPVVIAKPVLPEPVERDVQAVPAQLAEKPPALSLDDVKLLTKDSDFKPFMAQHVASDVRNAAMKKLFADPHFNVMDGLDVYIDDYSKSDPIPEAMLRVMTSSKFLKLFDQEEDAEKNGDAAPAWENTNNRPHHTVAKSCKQADITKSDVVPPINSSQTELLPDLGNSLASQKDHDDPHLRLQPNHAAPARQVGHGT